MKRRWSWLLIAANLVALVGLALAYPAPMVGPGPVVKAHAAVADCFACHAPFRGVSPARCEKCHALADIGVRTTAGVPLGEHAGRPAFHQELSEQDCIACHTDHVGTTLGQRSKKPFSHGLVRAATRERCATCHTAPKNDLHRALGVSCAECHTTEHWKPATFEHTKFFELDRNHAVACVTCHTEKSYERYTCYGCHEHTADKIRAEHEEEGIRNLDDCVSCHKSARGEHGDRGGRRNEH
jgi:hypothetical protein